MFVQLADVHDMVHRVVFGWSRQIDQENQQPVIVQRLSNGLSSADLKGLW